MARASRRAASTLVSSPGNLTTLPSRDRRERSSAAYALGSYMIPHCDPDKLHSVRHWFFVLASSASGLLHAQCATCHSKIAASFAKTGMARSFSKPAPIEPVRFYHQPSETWYAIEQRDGSYYQRRWRIGFDGKDAEVQESRIDYVMGSGNHVRTYLHRTDRGALIELPLAWYSENGGQWAMNPGHDRDYVLPPEP